MDATPRNRFGRALRLVADAAALPVASVALVLAPNAALPRRVFGIGEGPPPKRASVWGHALIGLGLGLAAWILLGFVVLTFARGALYGLFDRGPYDDAWGGPSLAGAWAVHFATSTVFQLAVLAVVIGIGALNRRLSASFGGGRNPWWAWLVAVVACAATGLFVVAWSAQI
ncbi:hypothetical protein [Glycomyces sp. YM15]|uniref:hypothetical protein n=1 Tax=Glycomyces sp. YM15 TaxID=2800446 RepID=UPI001964F89B|nr:hypothetical protein [Glycomyces sp. YM15]